MPQTGLSTSSSVTPSGMYIYQFVCGCLPHSCISQYPIVNPIDTGVPPVPVAAVAGGVVGGLILILIVIVVIGLGCCLYKKKKDSGNLICL